MTDPDPAYWWCNSCGNEVDDQFAECCDDGENEPAWDEEVP
jgi:predicted amidophosphoribosyltransferase